MQLSANLFDDPMRDEHPDRVRIVRIYVEDVSLAENIGHNWIVLADVPFATDPADAVHQTQEREFSKDQILSTLVIDFNSIDLLFLLTSNEDSLGGRLTQKNCPTAGTRPD